MRVGLVAIGALFLIVMFNDLKGSGGPSSGSKAEGSRA